MSELNEQEKQEYNSLCYKLEQSKKVLSDCKSNAYDARQEIIIALNRVEEVESKLRSISRFNESNIGAKECIDALVKIKNDLHEAEKGLKG